MIRRAGAALACALLVVGLSSLAPATLPRTVDPPILVTVAEVASDTAVLWLRVATTRPVHVQIAPDTAPEAARALERRPDPDRDFAAQIALSDLEPGTRYRYEVRHDAAAVTGTFLTAPAEDDDVPVTLVWSGDLGGRGHCRTGAESYPIFDAMRRRQPDAFLFVGDTIYADQRCGGRVLDGDFLATRLEEFHRKHRVNRADHAVQRFLRETSVYAIWDDHEVRNNFSGPEEPLMPVGRQAFQDYWAITGPAEERGRLYRQVRWGRHVEIFILDTRQYRSSNHAPDGPDKTMLGPAQRGWLLAGLQGSKATWKLIVSSVPLGIFTGSDSWTSANAVGVPRRGMGFVHERDLILRAIRDLGLNNVVVVSGDVHHAEIMRHEPSPGFVLHEFVAGPLAARAGFPRFLDRSLASRSLGGLGWVPNFGEIQVDDRALTVRIIDAAGRVRVTRTFPAEEGPAMVADDAVPALEGR